VSSCAPSCWRSCVSWPPWPEPRSLSCNTWSWCSNLGWERSCLFCHQDNELWWLAAARSRGVCWRPRGGSGHLGGDGGGGARRNWGTRPLWTPSACLDLMRNYCTGSCGGWRFRLRCSRNWRPSPEQRYCLERVYTEGYVRLGWVGLV
jgi:hypothetical protein